MNKEEAILMNNISKYLIARGIHGEGDHFHSLRFMGESPCQYSRYAVSVDAGGKTISHEFAIEKGSLDLLCVDGKLIGQAN